MAEFKYKSDVGIPSFHEIEAFCRKSGVSFSVTSTTGGSHVNGSYHYKGNAIDMGSSPGNMQKLAAWVYSSYSPFVLELIHSGGSGYFVKDGQKVAGGYYGAATVSQHYNHVHLAMTLSGIAAAQGANPSGTVTQDVSAPMPGMGGCAFPVAATLVATVLTVLGALNVY